MHKAALTEPAPTPALGGQVDVVPSFRGPAMGGLGALLEAVLVRFLSAPAHRDLADLHGHLLRDIGARR